MSKKEKKDDVQEEIREESASQEAAQKEAPAEEAPAQEKPADDAAQKLEKELAQQKEQMMRLAAEYDNFRKRSQRERDAAYTHAKADALTQFLPVLDNFERASCNADAELNDYKKGMDMIFNQFVETMQKLGVESFGAEGDPFDPQRHNAVMHVEDEALAENVVAQVFSKGYKLGDRVMRHAVVKVAN